MNALPCPAPKPSTNLSSGTLPLNMPSPFSDVYPNDGTIASAPPSARSWAVRIDSGSFSPHLTPSSRLSLTITGRDWGYQQREVYENYIVTLSKASLASCEPCKRRSSGGGGVRGGPFQKWG
eukprot:Hpha_TRINITY_DN14678_c0_g8::TRINITY_DN14678_c0_g8_i1::g.48596::m.48596